MKCVRTHHAERLPLMRWANERAAVHSSKMIRIHFVYVFDAGKLAVRGEVRLRQEKKTANKIWIRNDNEEDAFWSSERPTNQPTNHSEIETKKKPKRVRIGNNWNWRVPLRTRIRQSDRARLDDRWIQFHEQFMIFPFISFGTRFSMVAINVERGRKWNWNKPTIKKKSARIIKLHQYIARRAWSINRWKCGAQVVLCSEHSCCCTSPTAICWTQTRKKNTD